MMVGQHKRSLRLYPLYRHLNLPADDGNSSERLSTVFGSRPSPPKRRAGGDRTTEPELIPRLRFRAVDCGSLRVP